MKKLFLMFITVTVIGSVQAQTKRKSVKPATPVTLVKAASKTDNTTKVTQTAAPVAVAKPEPKAAPKTNSFQIKGANLLNAGIGVGTYYVGLPFGVSFEHGFSKDISVDI